ncbi:MAG: MATE family efflux transporter [Clostridia bacterium]
MTKNLTTGSPIKAIISFGLPILFGNLFQQIYNMTDSAIVGHFVSAEALGGVGATGSINFMVIGMVTGISTGFSINLAQAFGANDHQKVKRCFMNSIFLAIIISVILTFVTLFFIDDILRIMNTPEDIFEYSKTYISTIFAGIAGIFLYNLLSATLRALGDSKTPLMFLIASAILNVSLDLIFILAFNMGVFGTSLATVISQTLSGIACVILIVKKYPLLQFNIKEFAIELPIVKKLLSVGVPMGLQFSITAIGSVLLQYSINGLGTVVVVSITSCSRIWLIFAQGLEALGVSMANFAGQNIGAKKYDRINKAIVQSFIMGVVYSVFCFVVIFFSGKYLALIFIEATNTEVIDTIYFLLLVNSGSFILLAVLLILRNTIQGMGYSSIAMGAGIFEMVARILVMFAVEKFGLVGASLSNPVAWLMANIFLIPAFIWVKKKIKNKQKNLIIEND